MSRLSLWVLVPICSLAVATRAQEQETFDPLIDLGECVAVPSGPGPEDLVALPAPSDAENGESTSLLVSSAKRRWIAGKPEGMLQVFDLSRCEPADLQAACAKIEKSIGPELQSGTEADAFSPVGLSVNTSSKGVGKSVYVVESNAGQVVELSLPAMEVVARRDPPAEGSSLNGIGADHHGNLIVTNARAEPSIMARRAADGRWLQPEQNFRFSNGVALDGTRGLAYIADFQRGAIEVYLDAARSSGSKSDPASPDYERLCRFETPDVPKEPRWLPDNLHWAHPEAPGDSLLVSTWGGGFRSTLFFLGVESRVAGSVWHVDLQPLTQRLDCQCLETIPADCGIPAMSWDRLLHEERGDLLRSVTGASKVGDLLAVGQLFRKEIVLCPWKQPERRFASELFCPNSSDCRPRHATAAGVP